MKDVVEPVGLTEDELAELVSAAEQIADLRDRIAGLTERKDELTSLLRAKLKVNPDAVYRVGARTVAVTQTTTFDPAQAVLVAPPEILAMITVTRTEVSDERAKELLAPAAYQACRVPRGKPTVVVR